MGKIVVVIESGTVRADCLRGLVSRTSGAQDQACMRPRTRGLGTRAEKPWLLIKHRDLCIPQGCDDRITAVCTKQPLADIAPDEGGDIAKVSTG